MRKGHRETGGMRYGQDLLGVCAPAVVLEATGVSGIRLPGTGLRAARSGTLPVGQRPIVEYFFVHPQ
jgi:hypothetical protein